MNYIGIDRLWYGNPLTTALANKSGLATLLNSFTEVKNSHDGTFTYTHDDPEVTDYKNELNGEVYFRDKTNDGNKSIAFSMGDYTMAQKAELQGGTFDETTGVWHTNASQGLVYKAIIARTKTGHFVVFSNASIVAKVDTQEKGLMLGVTATAMSSATDGIEQEYWVNGNGISYSDTDEEWTAS